MTQVLRVKDLTLSIGTKTLLHSLSFEIPEQSIFAILGPNGAGKTLLLRCLAGLNELEAGTVTCATSALAWVPLSQPLPFGFRVRELIMMGRYAIHQGFVQNTDHAAVTQAIERIGIERLVERSYNSLSRGEQTKVDIARALASDAKLILLDEPFSNLDIDSALQMIALFQSLRSEGKTLVLSHHDLYTVSELATHALLLKDGRVLTHGPLQEVFHGSAIEAAYNVRATFVDDQNRRFVRFESLRP